jgi:hypothetical protein
VRRLHVETIYGFYHGQDPRTFSPDGECCSPPEMAAHKAACAAADRNEWTTDGSGCCVSHDRIVCSSSFGLGVYHVVMTDEGEFVRDATYEDYCREDGWDEQLQGDTGADQEVAQ